MCTYNKLHTLDQVVYVCVIVFYVNRSNDFKWPNCIELWQLFVNIRGRTYHYCHSEKLNVLLNLF